MKIELENGEEITIVAVVPFGMRQYKVFRNKGGILRQDAEGEE
jgi:hypothetical protein